MNMMRTKAGLTLIETLITSFLLMAISIGIFSAFRQILVVMESIRTRSLATALANERLEIIRNIPYASVGTVSGIPAGVIPQEEDVIRNNYTFQVQTFIRNIDHDFDGTAGGFPNDTSPADNKLVEIRILCDQCQNYRTLAFTAMVAPKNVESASTNGSLFIYVIDANGEPVSNMDITLDNGTLIPEVHINDQTNVDGVLQIIDAPPAVSSYEVTAGKSGWTENRTYSSSDIGGSIPVFPHATVLQQQITQLTLVVDRLSTINIESVDEFCAPVGDFDFNLRGTKLIGTTPDVYKYDQSNATSLGGSLSLSTIEWDTYTITPIDSTYDLVGSNPLLSFTISPNEEKDITFLVAPKDANTILVSVKDGVTGLPISSADVTLSRGAENYTAITGQGFLTQTDWSGGGGQDTMLDDTMYFSSTNIDTGSPDGELKLRNTLGEYSATGELVSSTFDLGNISNLYELTWMPGSQPVQTGVDSAKFQVATNNDGTTWNFVGPDGTASTYYTYTNHTLNAIHSGNRYLRYKVFLNTADLNYTPSVSDVSFTYSGECTPPGQAHFTGLSSNIYDIDVDASGYDAVADTIDANVSWQSVEIILNPS